MDKRIYDMANNIVTGFSEEENADQDKRKLTDTEIRKYMHNFRKRRKGGKKSIPGPGKMAVCAAALLLIVGTAAASSEVHAAIERLQWTIGSALGLQKDLEDYKEVVDTTVMDSGYALTLHEVVASEEELWINLSVQKEDGTPLSLDEISPDGIIAINGKRIYAGSGGGIHYLNEEKTAVGMEMHYSSDGVDLTGEKEYQIIFRHLDMEGKIKGNWTFSFTADASTLMADTLRIPLEKTFTLPNGIAVTLTEFTSNDLEQRIFYTAEAKEAIDYDLLVKAIDEEGQEYTFYLSQFNGKEKKGYLRAQDTRIPEGITPVEMTLYTVAMPKENGKMSNDFQPLGDSFMVEVKKPAASNGH